MDSIAQVGLELQGARLGQAIDMALMSKSKDIQEQQGQQVLQLLESAAQAAPSVDGKGQHINTFA